ncbi:hypothetical protein [Oceanimonas baumannii]|uniref:hypothetical protein n=1 Tax=Oceanimonas baumannii TaxID=129578 RepID=UPI003A91EBAD
MRLFWWLEQERAMVKTKGVKNGQVNGLDMGYEKNAGLSAGITMLKLLLLVY